MKMINGIISKKYSPINYEALRKKMEMKKNA